MINEAISERDLIIDFKSLFAAAEKMTIPFSSPYISFQVETRAKAPSLLCAPSTTISNLLSCLNCSKRPLHVVVHIPSRQSLVFIFGKNVFTAATASEAFSRWCLPFSEIFSVARSSSINLIGAPTSYRF